MDKIEVRQQLVRLESRHIVKEWFKKIHNLELNTQRTIEITYAARQSREFFKNAEIADYTVRPLLTFYGVSVLSKALILLLRKEGGEDSLTEGHGLNAKGWSNILKGNDISTRLKNIGNLEVETCNGVFSDLVKQTNNKVTIHIQSAAVDWRLNYEIPSEKYKFNLNEP